jgi:TolB-like protein/Tfp pilus assembly protein PilF
MSKPSFFEELSRRKVYRVAVTYAMVAWLIVQIVSVIVPMLEAPSWIGKLVLILLLVGFPIALILAWAYEMSPKGIVRTTTESAQSNPYPRSKRKPFTSNIIIGLLSVIIIGMLVYDRWIDSSNQDLSISDLTNLDRRIAVLPLLNLNPNDDLEYYSDGLTQEIIYELAKVHSFVLTAFSTTRFYKNTNKSHSQIASELKADYIMAGSSRVFATGDSVKLHIELIDPISQSMIWNYTFSVLNDEAPSIQLEIAKQVAGHLDVQLSPKEDASLSEVNTLSGEAFRLFLKAKAEVIKLTKEGINNGIEFLEEAIRLDSEYTQAHTLYAWANVLGNSSWVSGDNITTYDTEEVALPHINKALQLNSASSDIYLVRANMNLLHRGKMKDAFDDVNYALELNSWPRIPTDYCICTVVTTYVAVGKYKRAQELASIAKEVDPGNAFIFFDQATIHIANGKIEEAQAVLEEAVQVIDIPFFNFFLGWSYYHGGNYEKAIPYLKRTYDFDEFAVPMATAYLSNAYYQLEDLSQSEIYMEELQSRLDSGQNHLHLPFAMIAAARENKEELLRTVEKSWEDRDFGIAYFLNVDPIFKPYLDEPRIRRVREAMQIFEIDEDDVLN